MMLRSAPDGFTLLGRRRAWMVFLVTWLAPALIGTPAVLLQRALGTQTWGDGWLWVFAVSAVALISPVFTWFGLILAAPLVAMMMDRGWFGWLPALALGSALAASLGWMIGNPYVLPAGLVLAVTLRTTLSRLAPDAC